MYLTNKNVPVVNISYVFALRVKNSAIHFVYLFYEFQLIGTALLG